MYIVNYFTLILESKVNLCFHKGGVAQMVERSFSIREVPGSMPGASIYPFISIVFLNSISSKYIFYILKIYLCTLAPATEHYS